jgi:hypothetical protein
MNIKPWAYWLLGLGAPWVILLAGAAGNFHHPWLYVGCVAWFGTAVCVLLGLNR